MNAPETDTRSHTAQTPSPERPSATRAPVRHEHGWQPESRHPTSEGVVRYVRCAICGTMRVDVEHPDLLPPSALSRELRHASYLSE